MALSNDIWSYTSHAFKMAENLVAMSTPSSNKKLFIVFSCDNDDHLASAVEAERLKKLGYELAFVTFKGEQAKTNAHSRLALCQQMASSFEKNKLWCHYNSPTELNIDVGVADFSFVKESPVLNVAGYGCDYIDVLVSYKNAEAVQWYVVEVMEKGKNWKVAYKGESEATIIDSDSYLFTPSSEIKLRSYCILKNSQVTGYSPEIVHKMLEESEVYSCIKSVILQSKNVAALKKAILSYENPKDALELGVKYLNVALFGPRRVGKSSFGCSIATVFEQEFTNFFTCGDASDKSITQTLNAQLVGEPFLKNANTKIRFFDLCGFAANNWDSPRIAQLLKGQIRIGAQLENVLSIADSDMEMDPKKQAQNAIHAVVFLFSAESCDNKLLCEELSKFRSIFQQTQYYGVGMYNFAIVTYL